MSTDHEHAAAGSSLASPHSLARSGAALCALLALALALACGSAPDRTPQPLSVEPARGDPAARTAIAIRGQGFFVDATVSAGGEGGDTVEARYRAWLDQVELEDVRWVSGNELAAVVPQGLELGDHDLLVEGPSQRQGTLAAAFRTAVPAPALASEASLSPAALAVGKTVTLTVTVRNAGDAAASGVLPAPELSRPDGLVLVESPPPQDVAPGAEALFTFSYRAASAGAVAVAVEARGTDAHSGGPAEAPRAEAGEVLIAAGAGLFGTLEVPSTIPIGEFTVTMKLANAGDTSLAGVTPSPLSNATGSTVTLVLVSGPAAPLELPAGAVATFTWRYQVSAAGTVRLQGSASGRDAGSGELLSTGTLTSESGAASAAEAIALASDPFGDGTPAAQLLVHQGKLVLAPAEDGASAVELSADGRVSRRFTLAFPKDVNRAGSTSTNSWKSAPPYPSIGAPGCQAGTSSCGPDNEAGRALWASGSLGGAEWILAAGGHSKEASYVYLGAASGSSLDFRYVDLSAAADLTHADALSAALFDGDRLYLGLAGERPSLLALSAAPAAPGLNPSKAQLLDLKLGDVSKVGKNHTVVDALAKFAGHLHLGNAGGLVRAKVEPPTRHEDFADCTPSASAWSAASSYETSKVSGLTPADRAIPAFATWHGQLFAARNTHGSYRAPQLWRCDPAASGDATACDRPDWSLAARDSSGSFSRMNDDSNGAMTLLAATPAWLYVGYDSALGIQLFRTQAASPRVEDFRGQGGCAAGNPWDCRGLGGGGLGDNRNRYILDAQVLTVDDVTALYVATGDGTGPVRVYRIVE